MTGARVIPIVVVTVPWAETRISISTPAFAQRDGAVGDDIASIASA
jgi:hypothetical protein